ncbi:bL27 family ribosomal protein [Patescibacteria group bacterium]|nr:bL27 family ribosomal protein [Patescibacteria group bacterium]
MSHVKGSAVTKGNRDSIAKSLGVKIFAGEKVLSGNIIVRQRGTQFNPGLGVRMGGDYTLYAVKDGTVQFSQKRGDRYISVI